jgi:SAM-dependent methyltransferase
MQKLLLCALSFIFIQHYSYSADSTPTTEQSVLNSWENAYSPDVYTTPNKEISMLHHHVSQNIEICRDFFNLISSSNETTHLFYETLTQAKKIIEVGCGTGQLLQNVYAFSPNATMLGIDISPKAIDFASAHNRHPRTISYAVFNCLTSKIEKQYGRFDLAICSNTLEHFKDPFTLLDAMLEAADKCLILVPYKQPVTDGYDGEGGVGHVYTFNDTTFKKYKVLASFTFQTKGWQHSSRGEKPLQFAVLVSR